MGKLQRKITYLCAVFLAAIFLFPGNVQAKETTVSQTDICLPDMSIYLSTGDGKALDQEETKVKLDGTETSLTVKSSDILKDTERGIFYHVLLDVSTSISEEQLEDMKASVLSLRDDLRKQDKMDLITFGKETRLLLEGGESREKVKSTLAGITREKKTHLYAAINAMTGRIEKQQDQDESDNTKAAETMRNVGIILTDWQEIKDAGGVTSREETLLALQKTGTPLYGFCLKTASDKLQDDMGAFLRKTGGSFSLFDGKNKEKELTDLNSGLLNDNVLVVSASSNRTYEEGKVLEVEAGGETSKKENVYLSRAKEDTEKPKITSVEQKGKEAKTILVTFSEDVLRADNKNNYSIMRNGKQTYTVSEATYTSENEVYQAKLVLNDKLVKGDYEVQVVNITDNTNEENELTDSWSGELDGEGAFKAFYTSLGKFWAVILAVVILLVLLGIYFYIKKHKGIMVMQDKMVLGDNVQQKKHVQSNLSSVKDILLVISGIETDEKQVSARINGSIIVGRHSMCDIYFDDIAMSRQHFALSVEQGEVFLTDLESKGGTVVDGQQVQPGDNGKVRLKNGSQIQAGNVTFVIRWQE